MGHVFVLDGIHQHWSTPRATIPGDPQLPHHEDSHNGAVRASGKRQRNCLFHSLFLGTGPKTRHVDATVNALATGEIIHDSRFRRRRAAWKNYISAFYELLSYSLTILLFQEKQLQK